MIGFGRKARPSPPPPVPDYAQEIAGVRAELARVDSKTGTLLTVTGTVFSLLSGAAVVAAGRLTPVSGVGVALSVVLLGAATVVLLRTVQPALGSPGTGAGFIYWAGRTPGGVPPSGGEAELVTLSRIAYGKYRRIVWAVRLLTAGLATLAVTIGIAVGWPG